MSCGVGCRHGLDPVLLWPWCRPATTAPIQPLAWEPPYAAGSGPRIELKSPDVHLSRDVFANVLGELVSFLGLIVFIFEIERILLLGDLR